eukprot:TRINITY_DN84_c1_g1_i1.p3 TRINITY_DN84_c1_g1~~TRINITY_DN84_c1_g1_i1.p3  ORF type:complete len:125 (-),score=37.43 TRINITY_DN84_c1_g1_i1:81-455(-)
MSLSKHVSVFFMVFLAMWQLAVGKDESTEEELLRHADADKDGRVSLNEFITMIELPVKEIPDDAEPEFRETQIGTMQYLVKIAPSSFKQADKDGDGFVNLDEVIDLNNIMMKAMQEYPGGKNEL